MKRKYIFTYRSGPNFQRFKAVVKTFRNQAHAEQFKDGLRSGGATDVSYEIIS